MHKAIKQKDGNLLYPIALGLFDYFSGAGWSINSRYRRLRDGTFVHVSGPKLTPATLKTLAFA